MKERRAIHLADLTKKNLAIYETSVDLRKLRRYAGKINATGRSSHACGVDDR
jgi:hypothetical protein